MTLKIIRKTIEIELFGKSLEIEHQSRGRVMVRIADGTGWTPLPGYVSVEIHPRAQDNFHVATHLCRAVEPTFAIEDSGDRVKRAHLAVILTELAR